MKIKSFALVLIATVCFTSLKAQKLAEGTLHFLQGVEHLQVVFDYSHVLIQGNTEETIFAIKGKEWAEKWEEAKTTTFSKQFIGHLNKNVNARKKVLLCGDYPDVEYRATVRVLTIGRVWGITCEVIFTKTGQTTPLAVIRKLKGDSRRWGGIGGMGSNTYLTGSAFSFAGQNLGIFMAKKIK